MWETVAFVTGFALVAAGALSLLYPLRWIEIKTRGIALAVIAGGFLVVALGADMLDSYLVYLGLAFAFTGLISLLWPLRFLYIQNRRTALFVFAFGIALSTGAALLPYGEKHSATPTTKLDDWMPQWQVGETHTIKIAAPPNKVFAAIHDVRADEILLFGTLTAIRRCGHDGPENILNAPEKKPLLDVAVEATFLLLEDHAPSEIVIGTVIAAPRKELASGKLTPALFRESLRPGVVLATMNFLVVPDTQSHSTVITQTRIYANSARSLRRFGVYWRLIHPGSDLIRRMWLRAIARRAENDATDRK